MKGRISLYYNFQGVPYYSYYDVPQNIYEAGRQYPSDVNNNHYMINYFSDYDRQFPMQDFGNNPFVIDIEDATERNNNYRTAIWTGNNLQVTLMSINVGDDIGLEVHPTTDQFLRIEEGKGVVQMGATQNNLSYQRKVDDDDAVLVPAGVWHNIINTGSKPLKLYTIYAPPEHPFGTVHHTKQAAIAAENHQSL